MPRAYFSRINYDIPLHSARLPDVHWGRTLAFERGAVIARTQSHIIQTRDTAPIIHRIQWYKSDPKSQQKPIILPCLILRLRNQPTIAQYLDYPPVICTSKTLAKGDNMQEFIIRRWSFINYDFWLVVLGFGLPVYDWLTRTNLWANYWGRKLRNNYHCTRQVTHATHHV